MIVNRVWHLFLPCFMALLVGGCIADPVSGPLPDTVNAVRGVLVVNEGLWRQDNSTLTFYDPATRTAVQDYFAVRNPGLRIGDTGNDIVVAGSRAYITMTESQNIEVFDEMRLKTPELLEAFALPRHQWHNRDRLARRQRFAAHRQRIFRDEEEIACREIGAIPHRGGNGPATPLVGEAEIEHRGGRGRGRGRGFPESGDRRGPVAAPGGRHASLGGLVEREAAIAVGFSDQTQDGLHVGVIRGRAHDHSDDHARDVATLGSVLFDLIGRKTFDRVTLSVLGVGDLLPAVRGDDRGAQHGGLETVFDRDHLLSFRGFQPAGATGP